MLRMYFTFVTHKHKHALQFWYTNNDHINLFEHHGTLTVIKTLHLHTCTNCVKTGWVIDSTVLTLCRGILSVRLHLVNLLLQAFVLHLTHNGVQLLQSLSLWVVGNLNLWAFYLLLKLLMILCLTQQFSQHNIVSHFTENGCRLPGFNVLLTWNFFWPTHFTLSHPRVPQKLVPQP